MPTPGPFRCSDLSKSHAKTPPLSVSLVPPPKVRGKMGLGSTPPSKLMGPGSLAKRKEQDPSLRCSNFEATSQRSSIRQGQPDLSTTLHEARRMQPKTYPSTDSLQKGIDTFPDRASPERWGLATLAGGVERQDLWGVRFRDAGTGFVQKVTDGAIAMPSCAPLRGIDTKGRGSWNPSSLRRTRPTGRRPQPRPSRRYRHGLCEVLVSTCCQLARAKPMDDDDHPGPALPVLNTTVPSSTEHLAIVWSFSFFRVSKFGCGGGLADGLSRIRISTRMTLTLLLGEV